jgi:uncharacterized protein YqfA (UPF0365 family)
VAKQTEHRTKTTKETRLLQVPLTQDEQLAAGKKLAESVRTLTNCQAQAKSAASQFKAKIDEMQAKINGLQILISDGYELRNVPCLNVMDYTDVKCIVTRTDTGEIIEDRKLTEDEKQSTMEFDDEQDGTDAEATDGQ